MYIKHYFTVNKYVDHYNNFNRKIHYKSYVLNTFYSYEDCVRVYKDLSSCFIDYSTHYTHKIVILKYLH